MLIIYNKTRFFKKALLCKLPSAFFFFYYLNNGKTGFLNPIVKHDKQLSCGKNLPEKFPSKVITKGFFGKAGL